MKTENTAEIKARIQNLRERYAKLTALCRFGARINRQTAEDYAREIESLEVQLNVN
jgi:hypothetical protein